MYINGQKLKVRRYSSGELKLIRSNLDEYVVDGKVKILYVGSYSIFELLLVLQYYIDKNILVDLILAYLPYQRMDHKGRDELDTVNYVANVFNGLNLNSITICEPHCDTACFNNVNNFSYVHHIKNKVFKDIDFDCEKDTVVLVDKGGLKRYGDISKNVVYFNKERDEETGLIVKHSIVGDVSVNGTVVIVDDIISTGDTIVNILDVLSDMRIKNVYILAGHIENNKYNKRIFKYDNVIKVYSTNSLKKRSGLKLKLYDVKDFFR